ncbi:MAG: hypothetical protein CFR70_00160 [Rhodocyclaceae bacterium]|nr:MAG: hypothetical protein CFR70_00160 [Rhodocyclaceae bacterium]
MANVGEVAMSSLSAAQVGKPKSPGGRLGLIAMIVALQCAAVPAFALDDAAKGKAAGTPEGAVAWLSGGVGDEAMLEMRRQSAAYNVHVMLTGARGNYLAGVPFTVSLRNGKITASGVTDGPLLYLKLPVGRHQIAVDIDGVWQTRRILVARAGQAIKLRFFARGE